MRSQEGHVSIPACVTTRVFLRIELRLCAGNLTYNAVRTRFASPTDDEGT